MSEVLVLVRDLVWACLIGFGMVLASVTIVVSVYVRAASRREEWARRFRKLEEKEEE